MFAKKGAVEMTAPEFSPAHECFIELRDRIASFLFSHRDVASELVAEREIAQIDGTRLTYDER